MEHANAKMQECIDACHECHDKCETMLFTHCLQKGGEHAAPEHVKLMADCIAICHLAADFMLRQSSLHSAVCEACARICDACAASCESLEDAHVKACAEVCRRCAATCRSMSQSGG